VKTLVINFAKEEKSRATNASFVEKDTICREAFRIVWMPKESPLISTRQGEEKRHRPGFTEAGVQSLHAPCGSGEKAPPNSPSEKEKKGSRASGQFSGCTRALRAKRRNQRRSLPSKRDRASNVSFDALGGQTDSSLGGGGPPARATLIHWASGSGWRKRGPVSSPFPS